MAKWLRATAKAAGLNTGEDDAADWEVHDILCRDGEISFRGVPYRGEEAEFKFKS